ncbi:hypothetical protein PMAYCL1PPCAC_30117, partial [Pristionchus mayeri]
GLAINFRMPPPNKKKKEGGVERSADGVFRFELKEMLSSGHDSYSPEIVVEGVPWKAKVWKGSLFGASLYCLNNQSTPWSMDLDVEAIIIHSDTANNLTVQKSTTIEFDDTDTSVKFMQWKEFISNEKGFIKDGDATVEIRFWISNLMGIRSFPLLDFSDPVNPCHDAALVVEGTKIYVSKQVLAIQSPVFKSMFYGEFAEKSKVDFDIYNVNKKEVLEMLHIIYPSSCKKITDDSVENLLKLGDRFEIAYLIDRAEKFLIDSERVSNVQKLLLAERYKLCGLQTSILSELHDAHDFKKIQESPIYSELSESTVRLLFKRMTDIA